MQHVTQHSSTAEDGASDSWHWSNVQQLVVYGVGCIEDSRVSRYQVRLINTLGASAGAQRQPGMGMLRMLCSANNSIAVYSV